MKEQLIIVALVVALFAGAIFKASAMNASAAPSNTPDVECLPWADAEGWTVTRCQDWSNSETCLISSSGFVACTFEK